MTWSISGSKCPVPWSVLCTFVWYMIELICWNGLKKNASLFVQSHMICFETCVTIRELVSRNPKKSSLVVLWEHCVQFWYFVWWSGTLCHQQHIVGWMEIFICCYLFRCNSSYWNLLNFQINGRKNTEIFQQLRWHIPIKPPLPAEQSLIFWQPFRSWVQAVFLCNKTQNSSFSLNWIKGSTICEFTFVLMCDYLYHDWIINVHNKN